MPDTKPMSEERLNEILSKHPPNCTKGNVKCDVPDLYHEVFRLKEREELLETSLRWALRAIDQEKDVVCGYCFRSQTSHNKQCSYHKAHKALECSE